MPFVNCRHADLPAEQYHASVETSHSQLKYLPDEPELFHGLFIAKRQDWQAERKETAAMRFGTAGHALLLENKEPAVVPWSALSASGSRAGNAWKSFEAEHSGATILTPDEWAALQYAATRAHEDPEIDAYLATTGDVEHSLFAEDESTGIPVRGRLDKLCRFHDGLEILDIKISGDTSERWVQGQIAKMGYYRQAAFYWDLVAAIYGEPMAFTFLFVRNEPPYDSALWRLYSDAIDLGRQENTLALLDLARRFDTDNWHSESFGRIGYTHLPAWKMHDRSGVPAGYSEFTPYSGE